MLYKATEWKTGSGRWVCGCVDNLGQNSNHWVHPARILGLPPADYIKFMVEKFHPHVWHNEDCSFVGFYWDKQSDMRKYKNYINAEARKISYQI